jgi:histone acetyltransferase 1
MSNPEITSMSEASPTAVASGVKILTDEPRYSAAALSIHLTIGGGSNMASFRPEYTHQCVGTSEIFPGYHPPAKVLKAALEEVVQKSDSSDAQNGKMLLLHKSHAFHENADKELRIQVDLAPTCQRCDINISIKPSSLGKTDEPPTKRVRVQEEEDATDATCWTKAQILDALGKALPPIAVEGGTVVDQFLTEPVGRVYEEYVVDREDGNPPLNFVITVADGKAPEVADYHGRVQPLALFFIENADNVDVTSTDHGYWKVLYVFQKHSSGEAPRYSLVGYFTLFHFIALFHKPHPGIIVRICQALVLPPYQGQGHGGRMMQAVYKVAHKMYKSQRDQAADDSIPHDIVQVNVEDPAPAFVALRNKTDFEMIKKHGEEWGWPDIVHGDPNEKLDAAAAVFTGLSESKAVELAAKAKITPHQVHIVHDLIKLEALDAALQETALQHGKEELERLFRLMVKKRLNKEHREELGGLGSKDEQKSYLAELFDKQLEGYNRILKQQP